MYCGNKEETNLKRWFLLIEGVLCGTYKLEEEARKDYERAKECYPYDDQLVELAEVVDTTATSRTVNVNTVKGFNETLAKLKVLVVYNRPTIAVNKRRRVPQDSNSNSIT